jgi:DNA adenine methylase
VGALRADLAGRYAGAVSRWLGSVEGLAEIAQRLQRVQIENAPAVEVIRRYDTDDTLFYLDPPYVHSARGDAAAYGFEMTDDEHAELSAVLHSIRGRAVLSGYRTDLYDALYADWRREDASARVCHSVRKPRQESAWINF